MAFKSREDAIAGLLPPLPPLVHFLEVSALRGEIRPHFSRLAGKKASQATQSSKSGGVSFKSGNFVNKWHLSRLQKADKGGEKKCQMHFVNLTEHILSTCCCVTFCCRHSSNSVAANRTQDVWSLSGEMLSYPHPRTGIIICCCYSVIRTHVFM